jgi:hypothetical protein
MSGQNSVSLLSANFAPLEQSMTMNKKVLKSDVADQKATMIYSDRVFDLDILTKLRGHFISKCW